MTDDHGFPRWFRLRLRTQRGIVAVLAFCWLVLAVLELVSDTSPQQKKRGKDAHDGGESVVAATEDDAHRGTTKSETNGILRLILYVVKQVFVNLEPHLGVVDMGDTFLIGKDSFFLLLTVILLAVEGRLALEGRSSDECANREGANGREETGFGLYWGIWERRLLRLYAASLALVGVFPACKELLPKYRATERSAFWNEELVPVDYATLLLCGVSFVVLWALSERWLRAQEQLYSELDDSRALESVESLESGAGEAPLLEPGVEHGKSSGASRLRRVVELHLRGPAGAAAARHLHASDTTAVSVFGAVPTREN